MSRKHRLDLLQLRIFWFHRLYPIGNHVSQRIQAFSKDGKRGYLHSLHRKNSGNSDTRRAGLRATWPSIQALAERISPIWKPERGSRIARSGNTSRQLRHVTAEALEQNLGRALVSRQLFVFHVIGFNHLPQCVAEKKRIFAVIIGEEKRSRVRKLADGIISMGLGRGFCR